MSYYITMVIGCAMGFLIAGVFSGNRVDEARENGYRQGYKDGADGEKPKVNMR